MGWCSSGKETRTVIGMTSKFVGASQVVMCPSSGPRTSRAVRAPSGFSNDDDEGGSDTYDVPQRWALRVTEDAAAYTSDDESSDTETKELAGTMLSPRTPTTVEVELHEVSVQLQDRLQVCTGAQVAWGEQHLLCHASRATMPTLERCPSSGAASRAKQSGAASRRACGGRPTGGCRSGRHPSGGQRTAGRSGFPLGAWCPGPNLALEKVAIVDTTASLSFRRQSSSKPRSVSGSASWSIDDSSYRGSSKSTRRRPRLEIGEGFSWPNLVGLSCGAPAVETLFGALRRHVQRAEEEAARVTAERQKRAHREWVQRQQEQQDKAKAELEERRKVPLVEYAAVLARDVKPQDGQIWPHSPRIDQLAFDGCSRQMRPKGEMRSGEPQEPLPLRRLLLRQRRANRCAQCVWMLLWACPKQCMKEPAASWRV